HIVSVQVRLVKGPPDVRFGSLADICSAKGHVRFTPESDIKCDTYWDVRLGPIADLRLYDLVGALPFSSGLDHPPPKLLTLNVVPGLNPRIDPTQKRSDFFKSRAFEMVSSGGS